ncbi:hypothetical protein C8035_v005532 [Colletotrichum spinosum]|uniref:Uncharacterized protein n=1 Tax=Colletotrichum spinosum TaxID=1347390 RepID=A0A4V3HTR1_9PEZI|nr:hypothetical protein C8035_v005532 [Colletotrichum spinosum]
MADQRATDVEVMAWLNGEDLTAPRTEPQETAVNQDDVENDHNDQTARSTDGNSSPGFAGTTTVGNSAGLHEGPSRSLWPLPETSIRVDNSYPQAHRSSQYLLHNVHNELSEGDVLVFVDFPTQPHNSTDCYVHAWSSVEFRMHSQKLLNTGSSKFAEMLRPTYQFRIRRRRKLVNGLPEGIRFVLNLTPPSEGDDLVFQITEVSLTPGITNWWTAEQKYRVDSYVVSGHDDHCVCWKDQSARPDSIHATLTEVCGVTDVPERIGWERHVDDQIDPAIRAAISRSLLDAMPDNNRPMTQPHSGIKGKAVQMLERKSKGDLEPERVPGHRQIPDYCPVRHRANIVRLMCLVADMPILIDSAPRLWTLVAVAKILDCTDVVRNSALQWLMSPHNTAFVEVLPEESFKLGVTLRLEDITRAAFRILVNELAIEEAAASNDIPKAAPFTIFGRKRHDPGDDLNNLIQHAARAMVGRISKPVKQVSSPSAYDDVGFPEWVRLQDLISLLSKCEGSEGFSAKSKALELASTLYSAWKTFVAVGPFNKLLDCDRLTNIDDFRATYVDTQHFNRFDIVYHQFNNVQKALCPFIYENFGSKFDVFGNTINRTTNHYNRIYRLSDELWTKVEELFDKHPEYRQDPAWDEFALSLDRMSSHYTSFSHVFDPHTFKEQIALFLLRFHEQARYDPSFPFSMSDHLLLSLEHDELKYLPLWAGGNNDGTGGVFEPSLPPADLGPAGPGPSYHTGLSAASDASSTTGSVSSALRQMGLEGSGSTVGPGSVDVQDGVSTVLNPSKVVADDVSILSESFADGNSDFADARHAIPDDNKSISSALRGVALDEPAAEQSDPESAFDLGDDTDQALTDTEVEDSFSRENSPERGQSSAARDNAWHEGQTPTAAVTNAASSVSDDEDMVIV